MTKLLLLLLLLSLLLKLSSGCNVVGSRHLGVRKKTPKNPPQHLRIRELFGWIADSTPQQLFEEMSQMASGEKPQTKTNEYIKEYEVDNIIGAVFDNGDDVDED